jgi:hypothetical protein
LDRANETLVESEQPKLVSAECAADTVVAEAADALLDAEQPNISEKGQRTSLKSEDAAAYFQLLGLATSEGAVSIKHQESLFWLAKRFFFSSAIVMLMSAYSLVCLVAWIQFFLFLTRATRAEGDLWNTVEILAKAVAAWILYDPTVSKYAYISITAALTLIGWTCLHTLRNPILGWMRKPWAALQLLAGLVMLPIPNLAYMLLAPAPEAAFAGRRLAGRLLDIAISKTAGPVCPALRKYDRDIAPFPVMYPIVVLAFIPIGLHSGNLMPWLFALVATALAVKAAARLAWNRIVSDCVENRRATLWVELPVRVKHGKLQEIFIQFPSGKRRRYTVFYEAQNTPLEIEQLPDTEDWVVPVLFEESSARPVAIKLRNEIFPILSSGFTGI